MPVECQPKDKCPLWLVCNTIADKAELQPHQGLTQDESSLLGDFNQIVDSPIKSGQILGSQNDHGCIPFNHQLRNKTIGGGDLATIIFTALLGRELKRNEATQASVAGWYEVYTGKQLRKKNHPLKT